MQCLAPLEEQVHTQGVIVTVMHGEAHTIAVYEMSDFFESGKDMEGRPRKGSHIILIEVGDAIQRAARVACEHPQEGCSLLTALHEVAGQLEVFFCPRWMQSVLPDLHQTLWSSAQHVRAMHSDRWRGCCGRE